MGAPTIVRVLNNTNYELTYHNTQSGKKEKVPVKSDRYENEDWVPGSDYASDPLPDYTTNKAVEVSLGSMSPMKFSNEDGNFSIVYPNEYGEAVQVRPKNAKAVNGKEYVIRINAVRETETVSKAEAYIYEYNSDLGKTGYIVASVLQSAAVVVALVLMAIFL
ncbi:hypothetical protein BKA67DRAFT_659779 [Truncatella angustata]|uniref:Uncharacterized protein n=1 Tax=Truncatella angustata TaxID=152316 RepID=A0A9P8UJ76_9PEZI|nr:uncharacterized protein BKA67DRAFT_659779 [Truncatella angustata]KAH6653137.1 hypothetical protein BKA67DRAFT_659779 [Truncatella angustata]KAH8194215.1 hypothetical protein TruAng_011621 [Truncatella angustata]